MPDPIKDEATENRTHSLCSYGTPGITKHKRCENCPGPARTPDFNQRRCPLHLNERADVYAESSGIGGCTHLSLFTPSNSEVDNYAYTRAPERFLLDGSEDVKKHLKKKAERIFQDLEPVNEPRFVPATLRSSLKIPSDLDVFNLIVDNHFQEYRLAGNMSICVAGPEMLMGGQGVRTCHDGLPLRNDPEEQNLLEMDMVHMDVDEGN